MSKGLINEIKRMQQLAGLLKEEAEIPSNNAFNDMVKSMESALVDFIKNAKGDPSVSLGGQLSSEESQFVTQLANLIKQVKQDDKYTQSLKEAKRMQQLAGIINENFVGLTPINSPFFEGEDDDDMEDSDEEEYDFNAPGKKDEFDTDDDVEPTAKDIAKGDSAIRSLVDKQTKLNQLNKIKDELFSLYKAGTINASEFQAKMTNYKDAKSNITGNISQQIKTLNADLRRDLSIDDEEED